MLAPVAAICLRQIREPAGSIADHGGKSAQTAVGNQSAFDYAAENVRIDISAAQKKNDTFAGEIRQFSGKDGGQRSGGRAFDDGFLELDQAENRNRDLLFVDSHDLIDMLLRDRERVRADFREWRGRRRVSVGARFR